MTLLYGFLQQIARMRWTDYLDIAIVAFFIYNIAPLFFRRSTARISGTLIALVAFAALTDALDLYTLNFFFSSFLQVGLLALVVIFQPDLRRLFDRMGSVQLRRFFGPAQGLSLTDAMISQVVAACEDMSAQKIGALIVFTRESQLDEIIKTGTIVDARVSEQLIRNIFFPKAALHDGAMIIRDGRITAAGCVLPLSESNRLSANLGTRHRAGVGMSEVSDAVVVIVSEETGKISLATGGQLKRPLTAVELEKHLRKELELDAPQNADKPFAGRFARKEGKRNEK